MEANATTNVLEFINSFGYDCRKLYNLCLIDENTLVFASGNIIHFLNIRNNEITTRRSNNGQGIGHITKNPNPQYHHLTIAENGNNTPIFIYKYPEMDVVSICKNGSENSYTFVNYSPDGELIVSQGGGPDNNLTIWNWKESTVILRCINEMDSTALYVAFSEYNQKHLVSAGVGHIKCWNISQTFTGLKLICSRGRFEKRNTSDILAVCSIADEKVLSGCEWGNLLVWQGGLVLYEVTQKNGVPCHQGPITLITFKDDHIWTMGRDGFVRIWCWQSIDMANLTEGNCCEVDPVCEYRLGSDDHECDILWAIPESEDTNVWYAQDANGGIWTFDVDLETKEGSSKMLFRCHGGGVFALSASPVSNHVASLGLDGSLHIYNYVSSALIMYHQFPAGGSDLIWIPKKITSTGMSIVMGFSDGVIRMVALDVNENNKSSNRMSLIQTIKGHSSRITKLSINPSGTLLISGSEDKTIFIYLIIQKEPFVKLQEIGSIRTNEEVTALNWKPGTTSTMLIGCKYGRILEADLPEETVPIQNTYILDANPEYRINKQLVFRSIKSQVRRDIQVEENERLKKAKLERKLKELAEMKNQNAGMEVDETNFQDESDEEDEELQPLFIPDVPNGILWLQYTNDNTICLSMGGYDAGLFYEYDFDQVENPVRFTIIKDAEDQQIHSYLKIENDFTIFGLDNGQIRVYELKNSFKELPIYFSTNMHDNSHGTIFALAVSHDHKHIFSAGLDGNIFMYDWKLAPPKQEQTAIINMPFIELPTPIEDLEDPNHPSLEQLKQSQNEREKNIQIEDKLEARLDQVSALRVEFSKLKRINKRLPESQRLTKTELELDARITADNQKEIDRQKRLNRRKIEFDLEKSIAQLEKLKKFFIDSVEDCLVTVSSIKGCNTVNTLPIRRISEEYLGVLEELELNKHEKYDELAINEMRYSTSDGSDSKKTDDTIFLERFLYKTRKLDMDTKMRRLLQKYSVRKEMEAESYRTFKFLETIMPNETEVPLNEKEIISAFQFKSNLDKYDPDDDHENILTKLTEFDSIKTDLYELQKEFNRKVFQAKDEKLMLAKYVKELASELDAIKNTLPEQENQDSVDFSHLIECLEVKNEIEDKFQRMINGKSDVKISLKYQNRDRRRDSDILLLVDNLLKINSPENEMFRSWNSEFNEITSMQRKSRKEQILNEIHKVATDFDTKILRLENERFHVEYKSKLLECHLLSLYQEVWIIKDCQRIERHIMNEMNAIITEANNVNTEIEVQRARIASKKINIGDLEAEANQIDETFARECMQDQRFAIFLRKIYKTKENVKEADAEGDDDASSGLSSGVDDSSDGDDFFNKSDAGDSKLLLVEGVCPPDCSPKIFELTYSLRAQRMTTGRNLEKERELLQNSKVYITDLKKTCDELNQQLKEHNKQKKKLAIFRRKSLNEIETLLILKLEQLKHFREITEIYDVENAIVMNQSDIVRMKNRAEELRREIIEEKNKRRAQIDIFRGLEREKTLMESFKAELMQITSKSMMEKFGMIVNMDEMEESLLESFLCDLRKNQPFSDEFEKQCVLLKNRVADKQETLIKAQMNGIGKFNILRILQNRRNDQCSAPSQALGKEQSDWENENKELRDYIFIQKQRLQSQRQEIDLLQKRGGNCSQCEITQSRVRPAPDVIQSLVRKFIVSNSPSNSKKPDLDAHILTVTTYLKQVLADYESDSSAEALINIVSDLEMYLPKTLFTYNDRKHIAQLFHDVWDYHRFKGKKITIDEIIGKIIREKIARVPKYAINFSDIFLSEFLQDVLESYELEDVFQPEMLKTVVDNFNKVQDFYPMRINVENVAKFVKTSIPQPNGVVLNDLIVTLITLMVEKYKINDNIAALIDESCPIR